MCTASGPEVQGNFNERFTFEDEDTERQYQEYFQENRQDLVGDYLDDQGNLQFLNIDPEEGQQRVDDVSLERDIRQGFTDKQNEIRTRSNEQRSRSRQVQSNVARRREARTQQQLSGAGGSGGNRQAPASQGKPATLLSRADDERRSLLGGTL